MNCILIRFYAELNDFLPRPRQQVSFRHCFDDGPAVKDVIESLGIPHPEVGLIIINGEPQDFTYRLKGGEWVSVYPLFRSISIDNQMSNQPLPPSVVRFVLDTHLGKLARYLRMAGIDVFYNNSCDDEHLASLSHNEDRILLTRDLGLLKRKQVVYGYWVRSLNPVEQMKEVFQRYALGLKSRPFTRCIICNDQVKPVSKESVWQRLPEKVKEYCTEFSICTRCNRIYWPGTHYDNMCKFLSQVLEPGKPE